MNKVNVLGVQIDPVRLDEVLERIASAIGSRQRTLIAYVHVRAMCMAYQQEWLRNFLNCADLVYCDGMGVQLGARMLGERLPQRFALTDWIWQLAEMASSRGHTLYLLGNPPGVAKRAALRLQERYPNIRVAGTMHGYFDKTPGSTENEAVVRQVNAAQPDILLVGFGLPLQEQWLEENWSRLKATVALPSGALFEYLSGDLQRGPRWMTDHYLEWLARLVISPRRYWKRYLVDNVRFILLILRQRLFGNPFDVS